MHIDRHTVQNFQKDGYFLQILLKSRRFGISDHVLANAATYINDLRSTVAASATTWPSLIRNP